MRLPKNRKKRGVLADLGRAPKNPRKRGLCRGCVYLLCARLKTLEIGGLVAHLQGDRALFSEKWSWRVSRNGFIKRVAFRGRVKMATKKGSEVEKPEEKDPHSRQP